MAQGQRNLLLLVLLSVIVLVISEKTANQPLEPEKRSTKISSISLVNKDGSFEFNVDDEDSDIYIEMEGKVSTTKGRSTLELAGRYEFKDIALQFTANEDDGFDINRLEESEAKLRHHSQPYV
ncbi:unnamed protein product [Hermetia illucens]|uniref:Uncharacterized protein n=1 Tax=Hermetia illucens TaxID=343691 RepID=A0A7R8UUM5_HERIL|nr:uncharacterized protein LOC119652403 [Hermetia illucens]CAD7086288.1 unnamed protein product [Hermetia illucens]